jgi:hypothetical protein
MSVINAASTTDELGHWIIVELGTDAVIVEKFATQLDAEIRCAALNANFSGCYKSHLGGYVVLQEEGYDANGSPVC